MHVSNLLFALVSSTNSLSLKCMGVTLFIRVNVKFHRVFTLNHI